MTDLVLRAERVATLSRGHFLRLCAFCDRALASAEADVRADPACAHPEALLAEARRRVPALGRLGCDERGPDRDGPGGGRPRRVARAARGRLPVVTRAVALVA